jgi:hypothetical protein
MKPNTFRPIRLLHAATNVLSLRVNASCRALLGVPLCHAYEAHELLPSPLQPEAKANSSGAPHAECAQLRSAWGVFVCSGRDDGAGGFTATHAALLREWGRIFAGPLRIAKLGLVEALE